MKNERTQTLLIGRDVQWKQFENHYLRVEHFLPLSYIEQDKIKEPVKLMPYATLQVYDYDFNAEGNDLMLPVLHRLDFQHLWEAFKEIGVTAEEEVIVIYRPPSGLKRFLAKSLPHLEIRIQPKGALEETVRVLGNRNTPVTWEDFHKRTKIIAQWDPMKGRIL